MYEDFGERLRRLRTLAGLTQAELGRRLNRSATCISKYESGAIKPTLDVAAEMAFELRVTLDELFGFENASSVSTFGLSDEQKEIVSRLIDLFRAKKLPRERLSAEQYEIIGKIVETFYGER